MRAAAETVDSLHDLARLFINYFEVTEGEGWDHEMLKAAKNKKYVDLPNHAASLWAYLKKTARDAFQKCRRQTGSPLQ